MAKLDAWKALPETVQLVTGLPTLAKMYLSTQPVPSGELTAISNAELAVGWPAQIVSRASARRATTAKLWVGPTATSIGLFPPPELSPGLGWLVDFGRPRPMPTEVMETDFFTKNNYGLDETTANYSTRWANPMWAKMVAELMLGIDLVLIDSTAVVGIPGKWHVDTTAATTITNEIKTRSSADVLVVAIRYGTGDAEGGYHGSRTVYARFVKPVSMRGITGFVFSQACVDVPYLNANIDGRHIICSAVVGEAGWKPVIELQKNPTHMFDTTVSVTFGTGQNYMVSSRALWVDHVIDAEVVQSLPWPSALGAGPHKAGISCFNVYRVGDPEFVSRTSFPGALTWDAATKTLTVAEKRLFLTWSGARLVDMNPNLTADEKTKLSAQTFVTMIDEEPGDKKVLLTDLDFYDSMVDNDIVVAEQVLVPATEDTEVVTFGMAEERANRGDRRIHHQIWNTNLTTIGDIGYVLISGDANAGGVNAEMRTLAGVLIPGTKDDCLFAILNRVPYRFGTVLNVVGDEFTAAFGVSYSEVMAEAGSLAMQKQFDEKRAFDGKVPDMHAVGVSTWTAQMLVQHAINRKQLSSFVVASIVMATAARKKLT